MILVLVAGKYWNGSDCCFQRLWLKLQCGILPLDMPRCMPVGGKYSRNEGLVSGADAESIFQGVFFD